MEEFISKLIPLFVIVSIIFSLVNKAKKAQTKTSSKSSSTRAPQSLSLQEIIRQQIEEQKNAVTQQQKQSVPQPRPEAAKSAAVNQSLEMQRHSHNVHEGGAYNEGDPLNRGTLEGMQTEMQRHAESLKQKAYKEGDKLNRYTLEGLSAEDYIDEFDLDMESKVSKSSKKLTKPKKQAISKSGTIKFEINKESLVQGIIMSEILNKRGGRRALR